MPHSGQNDNLTPEAWRLIESGACAEAPGLLTVPDSIYIVNAEVSVLGKVRKSGGRNEI